MEVELYVYDLSKGLARELSTSLLGIHIDAVYHTSLVFGGIEYFFGAGVQTSYPGSTHHGRPMEVMPLGTTNLPIEIILEYLESLKAVYTSESYDLFLHNCNNFTNDFSMFLVGTGIPDRITSLPQDVLNTPFGQMLKPQLESAMRGVTQAPMAPRAIPQQNTFTPMTSNGASATPGVKVNGGVIESNGHIRHVVHNVTKLQELEQLLSSAENSCAIIFFTSSTCAPCKIVYPAYDELAAEAGSKAILIKVDTNQAYEIASKYRIRATPTFMTFLRGEKENEWSGANESQLRGNVRMLMQMAHPPHPHSQLKLPTLQRLHEKPVTCAKIPPLEKLIARLGPLQNDPAVTALKTFITARQSSIPADSPLPSLPKISSFLLNSTQTLDPPSLFPIMDLFRLALVDPRISGYFAEEPSHTTVLGCLSSVTALGEECPYPLRIVTLQLASNLFTTPLFPPHLLSDPTLSTPLIQLLTSALLDPTHPPLRVSAASVAYNMAAFNHLQRLQSKPDLLPESAQVELMAGLLEALGREERGGKDELRGLLLAAGLLAYSSPRGGELMDLCEALGARGVVEGIQGQFDELTALADRKSVV